MRDTRYRAPVIAPDSVADLLQRGEWSTTEFKAARGGLPKSAFETVCAFANTHGGWLVLGVSQEGEEFQITGVPAVDKVQNDFLSTLSAGGKFNHEVDVDAFRYETDGGTVLAFFVHENARSRKPVYLDGNPRLTFLRRGASDFKARPRELHRLMRDADQDRWGTVPFNRVALDEVFHAESIRWYRARFYDLNPGHDSAQPEREFLQDWGFIIRDGPDLLPTRAAVALFGSLRGVRTLIARPILDIQFLNYRRGESFDEIRWIDRLVCEFNIIQTWQQLLAKYLFFMPRPFSGIDPRTLERRDAPPGFRVFREAAMNLLIHQDYGDSSRKSCIQFFSDGVSLWNPGDSFTDLTELMAPGEKELRNPAIAGALQRIALCERAGTGLRMMHREWTKLGHPAPIYQSNREKKSFELFLADLEVVIDPELRNQEVAQPEPLPASKKDRKDVVESNIEPSLLTDGVLDLIQTLSHSPKSRRMIQEELRLTHRGNFTATHLRPALQLGLIQLTFPDAPRSPKQSYELTPIGEAVLNDLTNIQAVRAKLASKP